MWNHRTIAIIALTLVIVFGVTITVYPLIFNPNKTQNDASVVDQPMSLPGK
ncbi:hypothetical protein ACLSU7_05910 [Bdellovibrio sp. HCB185ZH]|uniref:hypothetical protein n=1 Tax=Bdellovibrio sp. HCB185ZH TaxID=3394235 RepID=UPI0039A7475C